MVLGWRDLIRTKLMKHRHEFVSADARRFSNDPRTYEMLDSAKSTPALNLSSPDPVLSPPPTHPLRSSPRTPEPETKQQDYYPSTKNSERIGITSRDMTPTSPAPAYIFASPTSPGMFTPRDWDPRMTQARPIFAPGTAISKDYI